VHVWCIEVRPEQSADKAAAIAALLTRHGYRRDYWRPPEAERMGSYNQLWVWGKGEWQAAAGAKWRQWSEPKP
jgi:phage-related protein